MIRQATYDDLHQICAIYEAGIQTGIATFETKTPTASEWDAKFHSTIRFVYAIEGTVVGWISVTPISTREVYKGVAEVSVYILPTASGKGIGEQLLRHLKTEAKSQGMWMLQSGIFEKNKASIRLHEKCGFRFVGTRYNIAKCNGQWENTVLMECHLLL